jgi:hypothetical protein
MWRRYRCLNNVLEPIIAAAHYAQSFSEEALTEIWVVVQFEYQALSYIRRHGLARPTCPPSRGWEQPPKQQPDRTMRHGMLH